MIIGLATPFLVNGIWTFQHSGHFVPLVFRSQTLAKTTASTWDGSFGSLGARHHPPSPFDVVRQAEARLAGKPAPPDAGIDWAGYIIGLPHKLIQTFSDLEESTFDYGYYGERSALSAAALFPVSFGFIGMWACYGLVVSLRRRQWAFLCVTMPIILGIVALTTLYHPSSRYRLPIVIPLSMLAGAGLADLVGRLRDRWTFHRQAGRPGMLTRCLAAPSIIGPAALLVLSFLFFSTRTWTYELNSPAFWDLRLAESYLRTPGGMTPDALAAAKRHLASAQAEAHHHPAIAANVAMLSQLVPKAKTKTSPSTINESKR
jgi:hypothetical protein